MQQQQQMRVDLANTEPISNSEGGPLFLKGTILRKVSKFVTGTPTDMIVPVEIYYDPTTMKIAKDSLPYELQDEYEEIYAGEEDKKEGISE